MRRLLLALSAALLCVTSASAQEDVAAFYKGKTIRLVVGIGVGSGYDINARALARHMTKHIPGNPQIIVQNQPGAGSLTMTNQLYNIGPFDGTAMGATFNGLPTTPLLQPSGVRFDVHKINWIGSTNRETQAMYVWHTAPQQTLEDLRTKEMIVGAQAAGSTQYDYPMLGNAVLGLKFKVITGYEATPKINLAMERGEVHGTWANWSTLKAISQQWLDDKKIRILAQWALRKHPEMSNVPLIYDVAKTDEQKQALDLALARLEFGRPFFLPPGVPQARVDAIRKAFDATMKDPEFIAEADKLKIDIDPLSGVEVAELLQKIYKTPADTVERVRKSMEHK
ncbi:tripartite tricarboxylate transporter substrate binding protein [Leptospira sp. severe_002]|uniref:Bug family tripartite tricarboxylate transporter substrate binding protein n=1 Tax=Leptospira sp. severe_002 TaxID=2838237 RepID=UPI001E46710E|nr:tripartite tricarboxylate transporter substrate-binding protein [Leptospira sp. severe_002]